MQLKLCLVITDPDKFLKGNYSCALSLFDHEPKVPSWINAGNVTLDIDVSMDSVTMKVIKAIDKQLEEEAETYNKRVDTLKQRKAELLSLPAPQKSVD